MPNAQTHLELACRILADQLIGARLPWLEAVRPAFFLGTISPDVRAISQQPREVTHFFDIPPTDPRPVSALVFDRWPELSRAADLDRSQAAFVAGYLTHLIMDEVWLKVVVMPYLFIDGERWGIKHPNWKLYAILMSYLEYQAAAVLPPAAIDDLDQAAPDGEWLPFVKCKHLIQWRDHVSEVIRQGGARTISRLFAESVHMQPEEMETIILSEAQMAAQVYPAVPPERLEAFRAETFQQSVEAVLNYLGDW